MDNTIANIIKGQKLYHVSDTTSALEAARYMTRYKIGAVPVLKGSRVVGIFSERDLMNRVVAKASPASKTPVGKVMTRKVAAIEPTEEISRAVRKMQQLNCRHLPVVKKGRLVGMVSLRDLMQVDLRAKREEIHLLDKMVTYYVSGPSEPWD